MWVVYEQDIIHKFVRKIHKEDDGPSIFTCLAHTVDVCQATIPSSAK